MSDFLTISKHPKLKPRCIWFTGLSGAGKTSLAEELKNQLQSQDYQVCVLDGDKIRQGLNRDLGFSETDRAESSRRIAEVACLLVNAGQTVIVSMISPFRADRDKARRLFAPGDFVEVFVDAPIEECERRDVKGLYAKVRRGELKNFTGIDSHYESPEIPDIHLKTAESSLEACLHLVLLCLSGK